MDKDKDLDFDPVAAAKAAQARHDEQEREKAAKEQQEREEQERKAEAAEAEYTVDAGEVVLALKHIYREQPLPVRHERVRKATAVLNGSDDSNPAPPATQAPPDKPDTPRPPTAGDVVELAKQCRDFGPGQKIAIEHIAFPNGTLGMPVNEKGELTKVADLEKVNQRLNDEIKRLRKEIGNLRQQVTSNSDKQPAEPATQPEPQAANTKPEPPPAPDKPPAQSGLDVDDIHDRLEQDQGQETHPRSQPGNFRRGVRIIRDAVRRRDQ